MNTFLTALKQIWDVEIDKGYININDAQVQTSGFSKFKLKLELYSVDSSLNSNFIKSEQSYLTMTPCMHMLRYYIYAPLTLHILYLFVCLFLLINKLNVAKD